MPPERSTLGKKHILSGKEEGPGEETAAKTVRGHDSFGDHKLLGLARAYGTGMKV